MCFCVYNNVHEPPPQKRQKKTNTPLSLPDNEDKQVKSNQTIQDLLTPVGKCEIMQIINLPFFHLWQVKSLSKVGDLLKLDLLFMAVRAIKNTDITQPGW